MSKSPHAPQVDNDEDQFTKPPVAKAAKRPGISDKALAAALGLKEAAVARLRGCEELDQHSSSSKPFEDAALLVRI